MNNRLFDLMKGSRDILKYTFEPFTNRPEEASYYGGKEGLDIADPLDVAVSSASSLYRLLDKAIRVPLVKGGMKVGDKLSGLLGEPIKSQEDLIKFVSEYDKKGVIKKGGYDVFFHGADDDGGNYWKSRTPENIPMGEFDDMFNPPGLHVTGRGKGGGIEPIVAAEETAHGVRQISKTFGSQISEDAGPIQDHFERLLEETLAKGTALSNVAKNEGIGEAVLSTPSLLSTWLSYLTPSSSEWDAKRGMGMVKSYPFETWDYEELDEKGLGGKSFAPGTLRRLSFGPRQNANMMQTIKNWWGRR